MHAGLTSNKKKAYLYIAAQPSAAAAV